MTDRELMQQALKALKETRVNASDYDFGPAYEGAKQRRKKTITALRERLAQPEFDSALQSAAMTQTAPKLAQPEQYQRPQMRRATREEKIDRPGVYWVPVNNIANSEAIPKQISEQEPLNLNCKSVQARLAAQWGYVKAEQEQKRPQNCGTSYCSCIECVMEPEQPEQKPVGEIVEAFADLTAVSIPVMPPVGTKLYTTPPRREWVGLTEEEIDQTVDEEDWYNDPNEFARAIEAKLREKNQ